MTDRPTFTHVETSEFFDLRAGHTELASIRLGEHEGRWFFALNHQQRGGDCWGSAGPLGFTEGRERRDHDSRDDALNAVIARLRSRLTDGKGMAPHLAWLDTLIPAQPDLFGVAA